VLPNLQGDVATDLAAALQGGMGMAASGNIGDSHAMFEPVHGSAPDLAGKDLANPLATLQSLVMLLEYCGETKQEARYLAAAQRLEAGLGSFLASGQGLPRDLGGDAGCIEVTETLLQFL
jgi:3-isopropylmalate dehydrogenase